MGASTLLALGRATCAIPLLLTAVVYAPILDSYFFADDFLNFVGIADRGCGRFALEPFGGHACVTRNLIMCAHYYLFGTEARWYFAVVLITHLVNVGLLFRVLRLVTARRDVACVGATLWGVSGLHLQSLAWYAVYGHVLSCTVLLTALAMLLPDADRAGRGPGTRRTAVCGILLLIGTTCFGTGLALAVVTPLAIFAMVPATRHGTVRTILVGTAFASLPTYLGLQALARLLGIPPSNEIALAMASSQPAAVLVMLLRLVHHGVLGLLAGPWATAADGLTVPARALVGVATGAVVVAIVRGDEADRRGILSAVMLALAAYGVIAVGRAPLSLSRGGPAVAATVQRYHYVGAAGLTIALSVSAAALCRKRRSAFAVAVTAAGLLAAQAWGLSRRPIDIGRYQSARRPMAQALARVDAEIARVPPGGTAEIRNEPLHQVTFFDDPTRMPGTAGLALIVERTDQRLGRTIRFWEPRAWVRDAFAAPTSRWLSRMLVPPHVHLKEQSPSPVSSTCELVATRRLLGLIRALLRCERAAAAGRIDVTHCQAAAHAAYEESATACKACLDPKALGQRVRASVARARWALRCMAGPEATPPPTHCSDASLAAADRLVVGLFACRRKRIVRERLFDDLACERRVSNAYRARLSNLRDECGSCFEALLAFGMRVQVNELFLDAFCDTLGP